MKQVEIDSAVIVKDFGEQAQLKLQLDQHITGEICMALFLLKENLAEAITLKFKNFLIVLKTIGGRHSYCDSTAMGNGVFKGQVSLNNLDYILHYILKFYRDGLAEAEHIDVDFPDKDGKEFTLTVSCGQYREYSADEIKKILE